MLAMLLVALIGVFIFLAGGSDVQGRHCAAQGGVITSVEGQTVCAKVLYTVR
ncbi:hypothetical protein [Enhydrobacter sp.]|uniref:hypothetical protein n=1 Tax=Enhydrobacter sp. TaxID=1894999 RepID=UPI0026326FF2|nr:hypothetical protein [Enhydrobacter sp.]